LDAGPLITQSYSDLHSLAEHFYTTPSVYNEIKDERARSNLLLWNDKLQLRQPKPEYVKKVVEFSKLTGDYAVLSSTDLHIIALCYEIECELNGGDWRLRKVPGQKTINGESPNKEEKPDIENKEVEEMKSKENEEKFAEKLNDVHVTENKEQTKPKEEEQEQNATNSIERPSESNDEKVEDDNEWSVVTKKKPFNNKKKNKNKKSNPATIPVAAPALVPVQTKESQELSEPEVPVEANDKLDATEPLIEVIEGDFEEGDFEDDDDWITSNNLQETLEKNGGDKVEKIQKKYIKAAMSTGDFAMQNVALQIGLNLVNPTNGYQIKKVKNSMLRCHACFKLCPFPKDGRPLQFCPKCGLNSLLRCTVTVSDSGKLQVHLKKNMQWSHRGDRYSIPSPQSKNARRTRHEDNPILLREDQKEYQKAVKDDLWKKRHNEKILDEWIGTGSADNISSPFAISGYKRDATRHSGVRIGRGRYINSTRKQK
jgi:RNA-binding protein NOB1